MTVGRIPSDIRLASTFAESLLSTREWIHRRVETVTFTDAQTVQRRTSLDFSVPEHAPRFARADSRLTLVPMAYLEKQPIKSLDVRDETDRAVSVLTTEENGELALAAVRALESAILLDAHGADVDTGEIDDIVPQIVHGQPGQARVAYEQLATVLDGHRTTNRVLAPLADHAGYLEIVDTLADNFVLVAIGDFRPGECRILKYSYVEPVIGGRDERGRADRMLDAFGLAPNTFVFELPGAGLAASYHVELRVPDGVGITEAVLYGASTDVLAPSDRRGQSTVHLMAPRIPGPAMHVKLNLRASPGGWLRSSTLAVTVVAVLLTVTRLRLHTVAPTTTGGTTSGDGPALLLAFVGAVVALVIRPGEHALTARLLMWARLATMIAVALPFLGAWLLAFGPEGDALEALWTALVVASWASTVLLWRIYRGPKLVIDER